MSIIKKNYHRLAKIYHPDIYKGKDKNRFERIQEAYKILSDQIRRHQYDGEIRGRRNYAEAEMGATEPTDAKGNGQKSGNNSYGKPPNTMKYEDNAYG
jgi:DnaJ-class molecular chaperone